MTTCGKCGAALDGTEKFCASCGAPTGLGASPETPVATPNPPAAPSGPNLLVIPDPKDVPPVSNVNPFAATASPSSRALPADVPSSPALPVSPALPLSPALKAAEALQANPVSVTPKLDSGLPPPKSDIAHPPSPRAVSPLAMSNGVSGPTPFSEALEKARQAIPKKDTPLPSSAVAPSAATPISEPTKPKKQGTQLMVNAPKMPPLAKSDEAPKKKPVPKTVAMDFNPRAALPPQPSPSSRASSAPGPMPQSVPPPGMQQASQGAPQSIPPGGIPQSAVGGTPQSLAAPPGSLPRSQPSSTGAPAHMAQPQPAAPQHPAPQQAFGGYPYPQQPVAQPQQGWAPPPPQYPGYFGYAPGARVQVTWSNGQRYPATVQQTTGAQCLVIFPDGQQHWVEVQYLSPG